MCSSRFIGAQNTELRSSAMGPELHNECWTEHRPPGGKIPIVPGRQSCKLNVLRIHVRVWYGRTRTGIGAHASRRYVHVYKHVPSS